MRKVGIVDVGGGYRGIYAAGVLDFCLDHQIQFDLGIGVSAGSANLAAYAGRQKGRNYHFYAEYGLRKEYASMRNFICRHSYIDLDYVYGTLSNADGENPLDYEEIMHNPFQYYAVATDAVTGDPVYFDKSFLAQDDYSILKASSAIPVVCHPYAVKNRLYFDGALADPVPVEKIFTYGCDKAVLLLTLPEDTVRTTKRDRRLAGFIRRKYPNAAKRLMHKAQQYNAGVAKAKQMAKEGKILIVAPDHTCGVSTLCKDAQAMRKFYEKGYADGHRIVDFLK